jgi:hypothetical protein
MLYTWSQIKNKIHDASGIENPEDYLWGIIGGIYYPIEKI